MGIRGIARIDSTTKTLVRRLNPGEIAVIDHQELDDVAAHALLETRIKAVINASPSLSKRYPNSGPLTLVSSGVLLIDNAGRDVMQLLKDGQVIEISEGSILYHKKVIATGKVLCIEEIKRQMNSLTENMHEVLCDFVCNTLEYARHELGLISGDYKIPAIKTDIKGRHVLIVVRGQNYKEDLGTIKSYIEEMKPLLLGVDGGADAIIEFGYKPDLIIGDMDSVSDSTLLYGSELIAHAYSTGISPGLERLKKLGLTSTVFKVPGTSEDIAMLLAYEKGAELIVLVGSHSNVQDFLEKGRKGMASTFLVRLKVGTILVDAKGVSKLYKNRVKKRYLAQIILAAMIPITLVLFLSPVANQILRLIYLNFKILFLSSVLPFN